MVVLSYRAGSSSDSGAREQCPPRSTASLLPGPRVDSRSEEPVLDVTSMTSADPRYLFRTNRPLRPLAEGGLTSSGCAGTYSLPFLWSW